MSCLFGRSTCKVYSMYIRRSLLLFARCDLRCVIPKESHNSFNFSLCSNVSSYAYHESKVNAVDRLHLSCRDFLSYISDQCTSYYAYMGLQEPAMKTNIHISYIQHLMTPRFFHSLENFSQNLPIGKIYTQMGKVGDEVPVNEMGRLLVELRYLNLDLANPNVQKFAIRAFDSVELMLPEGLLYIALFTKLTRQYAFLSKILPRISFFFENSKNWNFSEMTTMNQIIYFLKMVSESYRQRFYEINFHVNPEIFECCQHMDDILPIINSFYKLENTQLMHTNHFDEVIENVLRRLFRTMEAKHLKPVFNYLMKYSANRQEWKQRLEEWSWDVLSYNLRIADVADIASGIHRNCSAELNRKLQVCLYNQFHHVDIYTLGPIALYLTKTKVDNTDLIFRFQRKIVEDLSHIVEFMQLFYVVSRAISSQPFLIKGVRKTFFRQMSRHLLSQSSYWNPRHLHSFASIFVNLAVPSIGPQTFHLISQSIPSWFLPEHINLSRCLTKKSESGSWLLRKQIEKLQQSQRQHLLKIFQQPNSVNIFHLYQLTDYLVIHSDAEDQFLTKTLVDLHWEKRHLYPSNKLYMAAIAFRKMRVYHPDMADFMVDVLVSSKRTHSSLLVELLRYCSIVGHKPKEIDEFLQTVLDHYESCSVSNRLQTLHNLSLLQILPEKQLLEVFSLPFMEEIDKTIEHVNGKIGLKIERLVQSLNRTVVLECPQLNVPWFQEQFSQDQASKPVKWSVTIARLHQDVESTLEAVLGPKTQFFESAIYSSYHQPIDFSFSLAEDCRPLPVNSLHGQKCALIITPVGGLCWDSGRLSGPQAQRKRHLELLGYRVVALSQSEWFSEPSSATWREDLLRRRIFSATDIQCNGYSVQRMFSATDV